MSTKPKWEKVELLQILNSQRSAIRCDLHRELAVKAEQLTRDISLNIKILLMEKEDILKKNDLLNLSSSHYGCDGVSLNQELKVFDENTNIERKRILEG